MLHLMLPRYLTVCFWADLRHPSEPFQSKSPDNQNGKQGNKDNITIIQQG